MSSHAAPHLETAPLVRAAVIGAACGLALVAAAYTIGSHLYHRLTRR